MAEGTPHQGNIAIAGTLPGQLVRGARKAPDKDVADIAA
ncbi:hypothetical protein J3E64_002057 [Sphingobium sp. OAS761]|nr:hypothetical protein [Sphingobium sp. OAS761]